MQSLRTIALSIAAPLLLGYASAATEVVIHSFRSFPHGASPYGSLVRDDDGNLYGTTYEGGIWGAGVVFELDNAGRQKVLYTFTGGADGGYPTAGVVRDSNGNLYGTTCRSETATTGVVFKLDTSGNESVLHTFTGGADGGCPYGGVILDVSGNLYGTTYNGGAANAGAVYKIDFAGNETVLYSFTGGADGGNPYAGVIAGSDGNLYGTTYTGGNSPPNRAGVVYKVDPAGRETVLYSFHPTASGVPGGAPYAGVIRDATGNLYGATPGAPGVVFKLSPEGAYTILHRFCYGPRCLNSPRGNLALDGSGNIFGTVSGGVTGSGAVFRISHTGRFKLLYEFPKPGIGSLPGPNAGVTVGMDGNIYGTTPFGGAAGMAYRIDQRGKLAILYEFGGAYNGTRPWSGVILGRRGIIYGTTGNGGSANAGVIYKADRKGHETILYTFTGGLDGQSPQSPLIRDDTGNLYGATIGGGTNNNGVVYKLDSSGRESVLYDFTGGEDGGLPKGNLVRDSAGNFYGTTVQGGAYGQGVVYKLDESGNQTILHAFTGGADGGSPESGMVRDKAGNLYGTTFYGGSGGGVVYEIDKQGNERVLHTFSVASQGYSPSGGVILDSTGNLYGTTQMGGNATGSGVVFELNANGRYQVLYTFTGGADGARPNGLSGDNFGNFYGTATYGGQPGCIAGCGVIFKLARDGKQTVIHSFTGGTDGANPYAGVILDSSRNLYGTTPWGGTGGSSALSFSGGGVLYKIEQQ